MMATFLGLHFFFGKNELRTVQNKFLHLQIWPIDLYGKYTRSWHNANSLSAKFNYSSVPNRCVGQNKRAGGKILKKH